MHTIAGEQGLVLNQSQWDTHALNISTNDQGQNVIATRFAAPAYVELEAKMSATEITIAKSRNKIREDWMVAEQNLKMAIMDSVGLTIRHIIGPPPLAFQNMLPIDIINPVRTQYGKTTTRMHRQKTRRNPSGETGQRAQLQNTCSQDAECLFCWHHIGHTCGRAHSGQTAEDLYPWPPRHSVAPARV